jgi:hypothetical protein
MDRLTPMLALKEGFTQALMLFWALVTAPFRVLFSFVAHRDHTDRSAHAAR